MHRNYGEGAQLSASPAGPTPLHRRLRATWGRGAGGGDQIGPLCKCGYGRLKKEARWVALFHWIHPGVAEDQQSRLLGSQCRMEDGHEAPGDPPPTQISVTGGHCLGAKGGRDSSIFIRSWKLYFQLMVPNI